MKIKRKLLISYLLLVILFVAAGATITYNTSKIQELQGEIKDLGEISISAASYAQGLDEKQFGTIVYTMKSQSDGQEIMTNASEKVVAAQAVLQEKLVNNQALLAKFNDVVAIDENTVNSAIEDIYNIMADTSLTGDEQVAQVWQQMNRLMDAVTVANTELSEIRTTTSSNVMTAVSASQSYAQFSTILAIVFVAITAAVSMVLAITIGNRITNPLKKLVDIANKVSLGDLDQRHYLKENINIKTGDEIDELTDAFRRMINAFRLQEELINEPGAEQTK
jgi:methyl-accepting chemotaxis protein